MPTDPQPTSLTEKMAEARAYYNTFSRSLTADYVAGNRRTRAAIRFVLENLPGRPRRVLDIGCGIGWTSWEVACRHPSAEVVGVDLAPVSIDIARRLFPLKNLDFSTKDITESGFSAENPFDAVLLIDVYEHIPAAARAFFHASVAQVLSKKSGRVILTCPTPAHQNWLRENRPSGLQPVDEDLTAGDIDAFARAVGGAVTQFSYQKIWRPNDYFHAVIETGVATNPTVRPFLEKLTDRLPFGRWLRAAEVRRKLS